nr:hypothetical protein [Tanacetum cinerariifolium]
MPPRMMAQSAGQLVAVSREGGTSGRAGRGGPGSEVNDGVNRVSSFSTIISQQLQNLLLTNVAQVGDQGRGQGNGRNQNGDVVNVNIRGDVSRGCTYKEFLSCNPKEYDGKGGAIMYTHWIEKMESVQDMSGCKDNQKVNYTAGLFIGKALTWWNSQIYTRGREAIVGMSWEDFKTLTTEEFCPSKRIERYMYALALQIRGMVAATEPKTIQKAVQIAGTLTDEAFKNGSIKKKPMKRGNRENLVRIGMEGRIKREPGLGMLLLTTNPFGREKTGTVPKCNTCNTHHPPEAPCHTCFNCKRPGHFAKDCRLVPRNVNHINARNPIVRAYYECGSTDHIRSACPSFVSTTFIPLLGIEPSNLGFTYEIEIASGKLVEIDKIIKGCKLEIDGNVFDINLIPFRSGSFNIIIGMDWLSDHKAEINCHEKVVRIPLLDRKVLRVLGEKPKENVRQLMSAKAKEKKREEVLVVKDFPKVFPDDLSGLPSVQEIEFWIELAHRAMPIVKSPYRLVPSELEELSDPIKIEAVKNLKAPRTPSKVHSFLGMAGFHSTKLIALGSTGMAGYYRRFIEEFFKIAKPLTVLTPKSKTFDWGEEQENAFQTLKDKLCNAPILALPNGLEDFVVYCDVSGLGLGYVLMQRGKSSIKDRILAAQKEVSDESAGLQRGLDEMTELRNDGSLYYLDRIWVPLKGDMRTLIMDESHKSKYFVHPAADKMYYDLRD